MLQRANRQPEPEAFVFELRPDSGSPNVLDPQYWSLFRGELASRSRRLRTHHTRKNLYEADITVEPVDGAWKIIALQILDEKRIDPYAPQPG